jgi:hypothetical protein
VEIGVYRHETLIEGNISAGVILDEPAADGGPAVIAADLV